VRTEAATRQTLERAILAALARGRDVWPRVAVVEQAFAAHVRRLGIEEMALVDNGADLVLAYACTAGDEHALRFLHRQLLPSLDADLGRLGVATPDLDDVRQIVLERLLTSPVGGLASYAARSPLVSWLRSVVCRTAIDAHRASRRDRTRSDPAALDRLVSDTVDPELSTLRAKMQPDFQQALEESLAALSGRAKHILRLYYVDGLNIAAIGAIYGVHRATVARWITGIRAAVTARLRRRVSAALQSTSSEFRSLVEAVRDDLHVSVDRVLDAARQG
jgi:RNA polymerase sigma-70 factor, ECF subfamily